MRGFAALQAAGPDAVEAFIRAHDVENECRHGHVPADGSCAACAAEAARPATPDLMEVLPRVPARRALERVAAEASSTPGDVDGRQVAA